MRNIITGLCLLLVQSAAMGAIDKGVAFEVSDPEGNPLSYFKGSYALVIGVAEYKHWYDLDNVHKELAPVEQLLKEQGFKVEYVPDPPSVELKEKFEKFISDYGYDEDNRLLFFFSGHGATLDDGERGYLVPSDAPVPKDKRKEKVFRSMALDMLDVDTAARKMTARHALFLFDSCFSGTIMKVKGSHAESIWIRELTDQPVRYFITAGSADENVPSKSRFIPAFVDAIRYRMADSDRDGYVTQGELADYVKKIVINYSDTSPLDGYLGDYDKGRRGTYVFKVGKPGDPPIAPIFDEANHPQSWLSGIWDGFRYPVVWFIDSVLSWFYADEERTTYRNLENIHDRFSLEGVWYYVQFSIGVLLLLIAGRMLFFIIDSI